MFMKKTPIFSVCTVILLATSMIAMNEIDFSSQNQDSYNRLLSQEYLKIAGLESQMGTFEHEQLFKEQAKKTVNSPVPRPFLTQGRSNTNDVKEKIYAMRESLERLMVGYETRKAPEKVAQTHAFYDCYVTNVNINHRLARHCEDAFIANIDYLESVNQQIPALMQTTPTMPLPSTPEIVDSAFTSAETQLKPKNMDMPSVVNPLEKNNLSQQALMPKLPAQKLIPKDDFVPVPVTPDLLKQTHQSGMTPKPAVTRVSKPKTFKPVLPSETAISVPEVPKIENPSVNSPAFGIKPLSEQKAFKTENFKTASLTSHQGDSLFGVENTSLEQNATIPMQATDNMETASIPEGEIITISFAKGGTQLTHSEMTKIEALKQKIAQGQYQQIKILGHADKGGSTQMNNEISFGRAQKIYEAISLIVDEKQILDVAVNGVGDRMVMAGSDPYSDKNRRVTILLK